MGRMSFSQELRSLGEGSNDVNAVGASPRW
jgi:hypothetical protein